MLEERPRFAALTCVRSCDLIASSIPLTMTTCMLQWAQATQKLKETDGPNGADVWQQILQEARDSKVIHEISIARATCLQRQVAVSSIGLPELRHDSLAPLSYWIAVLASNIHVLGLVCASGMAWHCHRVDSHRSMLLQGQLAGLSYRRGCAMDHYRCTPFCTAWVRRILMTLLSSWPLSSTRAHLRTRRLRHANAAAR